MKLLEGPLNYEALEKYKAKLIGFGYDGTNVKEN